jgi:hypothetical protein
MILASLTHLNIEAWKLHNRMQVALMRALRMYERR